MVAASPEVTGPDVPRPMMFRRACAGNNLLILFPVVAARRRLIPWLALCLLARPTKVTALIYAVVRQLE